MPANTFIGAPVERVEDLRFLRGRGEYVDDLTRPGLLHAAILRSSAAHGLLRGISLDTALQIPGVHSVLTAADLGGAVPTIPLRQDGMPSLQLFEQPVIATDRVRYVGEPIAVVLADSPAIAEDGVDALVLDIEPLPVVASRHDAQTGTTVLFGGAGSNVACSMSAVLGDAAAAFANAPYTRREHFVVQRHCAVPMETRGLLAEWDAGRGALTVYGAAKVAFPNRRLLAALLGLAEHAVAMVENDVGGGFGVRGEFYPEDFLIPFAARWSGRPVKWIEDRREHMLATNHSRDVECSIEIACDRDGTILGLRSQAYADLGAYVRTNGVTPSRNVVQVLSGPYRIRNVLAEVSLLVTNKTPVGTYRGPGRYEADFFRERLFDMAAQDLAIDRVAFRRRNLISSEAMPYALPRVLPLGQETSCDSGDYAVTLDRCLTEIGWTGKAALNGKLVEGRYHGLGLGCYIEGGASGPREHARLTLNPDGSVSVFVGSSALGQGLETVFTQIAADALELPMQQIRGVFHGSTNQLPDGFGSYSSRSVVMGGSAIMAAAASLQAAIRRAAAALLGCRPDDVRISDGAVCGPGGAISLAALTSDGITVDGSFSSDKRTYSYGAHAAHVAVDPRSGAVQVIDYVGVEDVGRIINPLTLHGQTVGAIVQGLGGALLEHMAYDDYAQLVTGSLADYLLPTAGDFPSIRVVALESSPSPNNPLGAKGAGEGGIIPVGGVIANAVAAALGTLGVQPNALPLSPSRIWQLIHGSKGQPFSNAWC